MKQSNSGRKTPRAKWHDYNGAEYFITICTKNMVHYFGEINNGEIHLTKVGRYAEQCVYKISEINSFVKVPLFVIMPNHIHMILVFDTAVGQSYHGCHDNNDRCHDNNDRCHNNNDRCHNVTALQEEHDSNRCDKNVEMMRRANCCGSLSHIIGRFKSAVTKYANENDITFAWQTRFHDRIIRNRDEMNRIAEYIKNNPIVWK